MRMCDKDIAIKINGQSVGPGDIAFHFQSDPFPGGLVYEALIGRAAINAEVWNYAKLETAAHPTEDQVRHWFLWLFHICARHPDSTAASAMPFVVNTIDQMRVDEDKIEFCGEASPYLSKENGPKSDPDEK